MLFRSQGLDFDVEQGEFVCLMGPSGSGKTTLLHLLAGIDRPTEGTVRIAGLDHTTAPRELKSIVGLVPDTPPLYEYLTGRQYVALVASLWRVGRRERDERAARLLHELGLDDVADELCRCYSHGTRKKIHLTAVLTTQPRVLLLDEPSTGLDPRSVRALKDLLLAEAGRGTTVLFSTHVLETAEQICHRVGILHRGRLRAEGTVAELRAAHGDATLEATFLRLTAADGEGNGAAAR